MKLLCELQEYHGVDFGEKYKTDYKSVEFVSFIAGCMKKQLLSLLDTAKFSVQCDGWINAGNIEDDLFLVLYFD